MLWPCRTWSFAADVASQIMIEVSEEPEIRRGRWEGGLLRVVVVRGRET